ncbi:hypothetical protein ISS08_01545 [Candidatus Pacearchaeota archaeon]|nr:hypothetical protein [Candidatus Pacearchaeota archaeon]
MEKHCIKCKKLKEHHGNGYCFNCYRKYSWKQKLKTCKRCKREKPMHAKGFCASCYNFVFHIEQAKAWNYKNRHDLDIKVYQRITKNCVVCGFDKVVELHHLDHNPKNNSEINLIGLCPNHHKMIHRFKYREEILGLLEKKGFKRPEDPKLAFTLED